MTKNISKKFKKSAPDTEIEYITVSKWQNGERSLCIENLYLNIPNSNTTLIENLNMVLEKGSRVILTGASGSGKSNLLHSQR